MTPAEALLALRALLALALYAFLALVVITLWRDLRGARRQAEGFPAAQLRALDRGGPPAPCLLREENTLGRAADNVITLDDETVSSYHARLSYQGGQWWLQDLGSRNGTRLNDVAVDQPLVAAYGDEIVVGRVRLALEPAAPAPPSAPGGG
jgi:pSer/pThr/pTyr-binding forkhead associated (FHA) protein